MTDVVLVIGPGSIGQAIARRISAGKHVVLADLRRDNADAAAQTLRNAGFDVSIATVDVSWRGSVRALIETARTHGEITRLVHAAGVSPSQAPIEAILAVDLYGTAMLLEELGNVIAPLRRTEYSDPPRRSWRPGRVARRLGGDGECDQPPCRGPPQAAWRRERNGDERPYTR